MGRLCNIQLIVWVACHLPYSSLNMPNKTPPRLLNEWTDDCRLKLQNIDWLCRLHPEQQYNEIDTDSKSSSFGHLFI